jgi:hypothetical protein
MTHKGKTMLACIICGYIHAAIPRGVSALGSGDLIPSHQRFEADGLAKIVAVPPAGMMTRPPYRCAWERVAPVHQEAIRVAASEIADCRNGKSPVGLLTRRYVAVLAIDDPRRFNARIVSVGIIDDGDEPVRILIGPAKLLHSGLFGREWHAKSLVTIPTEIAPGSREGIERATKTAVREALRRLHP